MGVTSYAPAETSSMPGVTPADLARDHEGLSMAVTGILLVMIVWLALFAWGHATEASGPPSVVGLLICGVSILGGLLNSKHEIFYGRHTAMIGSDSTAGPVGRSLVERLAGLYRLWPFCFAVTFALGLALILAGGPLFGI